MASINVALGKVKGELTHLLDRDLLRHLSADEGHRWRDRVLDPATTILLLVTQVLHGNAAVNQLRRIGATLARFTDTAYCQARARLPVAVLKRLLRRVAAELPDRAPGPGDQEGRFRGHRVFLIDGSSASMPDTPQLKQRFGQPAGQLPECGFPVAHALYLMHAFTGMILDVIISPLNTHDMRHAADTHRRLCPGDLLGGDRAFCSFAHLALLTESALHGLFRIHQRTLVNFTPGRRHARRGGRGRARDAGLPTSRWIKTLPAPRGLKDQVVEWFKPRDKPGWLSPEKWSGLPPTIRVRELRYRVTRRGYRTRALTVATTLLDPRKYPAQELTRLYLGRWQIEINFRHLKHTMGMDVLRCKTTAGVTKELLAYAIAYNLVCLVMHQAARRQGVAPQRISFVDALRWLIHHDADDALPTLVINPLRPGRAQPRAVKRRSKQYDLLNKPRRVLLAQLLGASAVAA